MSESLSTLTGMEPSNHEYKYNASSAGAVQTMFRDVGRDVHIKLPQALGKRTKTTILALTIFWVIAVPAITVLVYLKVHSR